jgi:FlaA1/EpsC-like NDP-sugar epimerase
MLDTRSAPAPAVTGSEATPRHPGGGPAAAWPDLFAPANLPVLLGRPLRSIPIEEGERQLARARILVTGAAGSVGAALVPRLLALKPEIVVAVDTHEASLFRLGREQPPEAALDLRVADVRNEPKMRRLFNELRPEIVFHLAAYKHVPLGEREADEPASVNVLGTDIVARAAIDHGVRHLIYPSSDKAVNPPSVYGATKRLAETVLLAHAAARSPTAIHLLRYVNILGSSGSALETFAQQALSGSPLTLTDPRMTRYWMAMDEAVDLLFNALSLPSGSRTLLDAGEPIPVKVIAERLYQLVRGDDTDPEFRITGVRPGERLAEELASPSERLVPSWEGVLSVLSSRAPDERATRAFVDELEEILGEPDQPSLRSRLMELARELQ